MRKVINLGLVALLGLVAIGKLYVVTHPALVDRFIVEGYPAQAATWLAENRGGGRLFNEYNWGGYLQWALPGFPTFVDGRTDLFGDQVVGAWINVIQAGAGWKDTLAHYQVDFLMLEPDRPVVRLLPEAGWKLLYQDSQAVIFGY